MQRILKKYKSVSDVIIFGSYVKGRDNPKDLDLALIVAEKDLELVHSIKEELGVKEVHLELIKAEEVYLNTLFLSLINEGFSIKRNKFLREALGTRPMRLYSYNLIHLKNRSQKTLFGIALNKTLHRIKGEKVGPGVVLVPIEQTSEFEDFLDAWGMKYKTKEWTVI